MAAQNSAGIQTLLDAEREAQKIVQKGTLPNKTSKGRPIRSSKRNRGVPKPERRGVQAVRVAAHIRQQESRRRRGQGDESEVGRDQGHWEEDRAQGRGGSIEGCYGCATSGTRAGGSACGIRAAVTEGRRMKFA
ncbi:hypothetical protein CB0940_07816 [Cercospora beticola]|uniref:Uncharacterized protein n=1 Tax=Cercospora beticola TaxID=122368 RepID=A0A2G5H7J9_CERBT|nr:hypothetical protein CB0940_07816 [Cercospora beticola]PIA88509.1 hypothetical protein CB0940_07816 [Cercospora beticola]